MGLGSNRPSRPSNEDKNPYKDNDHSHVTPSESYQPSREKRWNDKFWEKK